MFVIHLVAIFNSNFNKGDSFHIGYACGKMTWELGLKNCPHQEQVGIDLTDPRTVSKKYSKFLKTQHALADFFLHQQTHVAPFKKPRRASLLDMLRSADPFIETTPHSSLFVLKS